MAHRHVLAPQRFLFFDINHFGLEELSPVAMSKVVYARSRWGRPKAVDVGNTPTRTFAPSFTKNKAAMIPAPETSAEVPCRFP
jgi:hypothetical protein